MRVALIAAVLAFTSLAHAQPAETGLTPPGMTPSTQPVTQPTWIEGYHGRMLLVDGFAFGLFTLAITQGEDGFETTFPLSAAVYVSGGPTMHLTTKHYKRAAISLAMRVALPYLGYKLGDWKDGSNSHESAGGFALIGIITAMFVDDFYLARGEPAPRAEPGWTPTAQASQNGATVGLSGSF